MYPIGIGNTGFVHIRQVDRALGTGLSTLWFQGVGTGHNVKNTRKMTPSDRGASVKEPEWWRLTITLGITYWHFRIAITVLMGG